ncbi:hypothetical protein RRG08_023036 [Elysia crispata]|uniref:Uncharacterized protein n=1 Tax=Elysia crispata TaxID=231223 RepID=A0AAE0YLP8_9GAST|nr:hypothetical protein RRG08_023036 [Elysia crispata]
MPLAEDYNDTVAVDLHEICRNIWYFHMFEEYTSLHATRKAFIKAESSEKIRRALRKQVRPWSGQYQMGDRVFYMQPDSHERRGPGTAIGQDECVIFVRHGGTLIHVHQSTLQMVKGDLEQK